MTYYSSKCSDVSTAHENSFQGEVEERDPLDDLDLPPIESAEDFIDLSEFYEPPEWSKKITADAGLL